MSNINTYTPQSALPSGGVPATGEFTPTENVEANTYNTPTATSDAPYNETLIGNSADNLVGSASKPYLPMALPTYIPTLYENVFNIQTNLKNLIDPNTAQPDNREYPTSYAVKNYVNSVLFGTETLIPDDNTSSTELTVSTGVTTTACKICTENPNPNVVATTSSSGNMILTTFFNINNVEDARSGATKNIICISPLPVGSTTLNMQIRLTGDKVFLVNGKQYDTYSFVAQGDALTMIQFLNGTTSIFYVITYGGSFSTNNWT